MTINIGVDGCKAGWFVIAELSGRIEFGVLPSMRELLRSYQSAECVLVDIPIGLPWRGCKSRPCDELARSCLRSPRAASVFSAPCRAASRADTFASARALNLEELGRSLSAQAFGICSKIAEVDALLLSDPVALAKVHEVHPEICFWALNGCRAMLHAKKTPIGVAERIEVLTRSEPRTSEILAAVASTHPRKHVQVDDVLDALVALVTARAGRANLHRLQGDQATDQLGLPMKMLYLEPARQPRHS